jgi:hypothetical protein
MALNDKFDMEETRYSLLTSEEQARQSDINVQTSPQHSQSRELLVYKILCVLMIVLYIVTGSIAFFRSSTEPLQKQQKLFGDSEYSSNVSLLIYQFQESWSNSNQIPGSTQVLRKTEAGGVV